MLKTVVVLLVLLFCNGCNMMSNTPQKKYIPTPEASQPADHSSMVDLEFSNISSGIKQDISRFEGKAGLFAKNIKTGKTLSVNADRVFPTASTHKLIVALAIYKYIYPTANQDEKEQYDKNIRAMMVTSDNPAFYELLDEIKHTKPDALTTVLSDLSLKHTRIHSGEAFKQYGYHSVTTPSEMAVVFETIYNENYLGKEMSAILKEELAHTIFHNEIPRFMQKNKVMHKVGELPGLMCDVGIVDDGKDQILISVFATTKKSPDYASDLLANLSAKAYNALRTK